MWLSFRAAQASIVRWGWKAVLTMGEERLWWRKLEYGSKVER